MTEKLTLGVEEEFQIVRAASGELAPGYHALMRRATSDISAHMHPEYYQCVLETTTSVCPDVETVWQETMALRATAMVMARRNRLALISAGTHPTGNWTRQQRTEDTAGRYAMIEDVLADVARTLTIYGLHVHVGIADESRRIAVMAQTRTFLPYILALSANSPFWMGRLTGYQSFRTIVWAPFPLANVPDAFSSLADYQEFHALLERGGALAVPRRIWWDVRPHHTLPTLEYRVADMPLTHADMVSQVAFIQALAHAALMRFDQNHPLPIVPTAILAENKWRAARWGLRGAMIDYTRRCEAPTVDLIAEALDLVKDSADELGTLDHIAHLRAMLQPGYQTGAERQIAAHERRGRIGDSMRMLMQETARGIDMASALPLASRPLFSRISARHRLRHSELSAAPMSLAAEEAPDAGASVGSAPSTEPLQISKRAGVRR